MRFTYTYSKGHQKAKKPSRVMPLVWVVWCLWHETDLIIDQRAAEMAIRFHYLKPPPHHISCFDPSWLADYFGITSPAHGVFPDRNYRVWDLVRAHNSMIRGHFGLGMVWSEVTSVWGWYDQRSLQSEDGMIRCHFGLGMVWSEADSSAH